MITPSFSPTATERVLPKLALDFTTASLDSRVTFTRASTGTYYNGTTTAMAEQNLNKYSQDFSQTVWNKSSVNTYTYNAATAPDGTSTAALITETTGTGWHGYFHNVSSTTPAVLSGSNTISVYIKIASGSRYQAINFIQYGGLNYAGIIVDSNFAYVSTFKTGSNITVSSYSITSVGNGWYRVSVTASISSAALVGIQVQPMNTTTWPNGNNYAGDGTSGAYVWGAQLEQRSTATAYTPTTTQPITNYIPVLMTAAINEARLDHNPITRESLGLLIEEQRTNLFTYSQDFTNSVWSTEAAATLIPNAAVAPDGSLTFSYVRESTANTSRSVYTTNTYSLASGTTSTWSCYAKSTNRGVKLETTDLSSGSCKAIFNLQTGTVVSASSGGSWTNTSANIVSVGNGVYRCSITSTKGAGSGAKTFIALTLPNGTDVYQGDGYSGIYIWGAQLEAGAFATSYIPTTTTALTRNADVATMTGTNFSGWYNATKGTFRVDAISPARGTRPIISTDDNSANNSLLIKTEGTAPTLVVTQSGSEQANVAAGTITANADMYAYVSYDSNYFGIARASSRQVDTTGTVPTVDRLRIGASQAGAYLSGTIKKLQFWS